MRVFLAGATGVIGVRLVPLLVADGHQVAGMTRSAAKADALRASGAEPVVCSLFDAAALRDAVVAFEAEAVMHQVTDLPDERARIPEFADANARIRREGNPEPDRCGACGWCRPVRRAEHRMDAPS
jgi:nucleoside-diphosphate-sugar epimerase